MYCDQVAIKFIRKFFKAGYVDIYKLADKVYFNIKSE